MFHSDEFASAEQNERNRANDLVAALQAQGYEVTASWAPVGSYARIDGVLTINGKRYPTELKVRKGNADRYPDGMLELNKYYALKRRLTKGAKPLYIFLYDDAALIWPIARIAKLQERDELDFASIPCPATSYGTNRNTTNKSVVLLPLKYAIRIPLPTKKG